MKIIRKYKWILALFVILFTLSTVNLEVGKAHSPKYIDLKYYDDDQILSVYITHGVSNLSYHYVATVKIEFYELLNNSFKAQFESDIHITEPLVLAYGIPNKTQEFIYHYVNQSTHQVFHNNFTLPAEEWTLINVTAICNQGGQFSNTMVVGHYPYYDIEHSMLEAVVPTTICAIVTMIPLIIIRIARRNKPDQSKKIGVVS